MDIFESAGREIQQLERQIELLGKSNQEVATAEARWAMLDAAKKAKGTESDLDLDADDLRGFLERTLRLVPAGSEARFLHVEDELANLFGHAA